MLLAYKPGRSLFNRTDPLMKFVWICIIAGWLYTLRDIKTVLPVTLGVTIFSFLAARVGIWRYLKITLIMAISGWGMIVYQGWARPGEGISIWFLNLSYTGMEVGIAIVLRTFGLVASTIAYSVSTSPQELEMSMIKVGIPYRFSRIAYLALRMIPTYQYDLQAIDDVQTLRKSKKGFERIKTTLAALLATEMRSVDTIAIALDVRGFGAHKTRTELNEVHVSKKGLALVIVTIALMIVQLVYFQ